MSYRSNILLAIGLLFCCFLIIALILSSCSAEDKPEVQGCMDPNSMSYNPHATVSDPQSCLYGGQLSIYRTSTADPGDSLEFWGDTVNGKGLHHFRDEIFNRMPTTVYPCGDPRAWNLFMALGKQIYQFKKRLVNGQVIVLTQPDTINVYNKLCKTIAL